MSFLTLEQMIVASAEAVRPPERMTVEEAASRYRHLNNPGSYVGPWLNEKTPYLVEPMQELTSLDFTGLVFVGPAQSGKALDVETPIATPTGWTTMGDLRVGDEIFDNRGQICRVTFATEVMLDRPCYEVSFFNGGTLIADLDHKWEVNDAHRPNVTHIVTTRDFLERGKYGRDKRNRYSVDLCQAIQTPADNSLPVDPYVLGAWLGDGHSAGARIYSGRHDVEQMRENLAFSGVATRAKLDSENCFVVALSARRNNPGRKGEAAGVSAGLRTLGLGQTGKPKRIPTRYLRASVEQRRALLRGLMDTDGCVGDRGNCEFCTTAPGIAEPFGELLTSLGYKYGLSKVPAAQKIAYRFAFYVRPGDAIFDLPRKQSRLDASAPRRSLKRVFRRQITSVRSVPSVPVRCIQVDSPTHLFLAGKSMIPTHNTDMALNWITYTAMCDPADMMIIQTAMSTARDFSKSKVEKLFRYSKVVGNKRTPGRQNRNTFDTSFTAGWRLTMSWPSINELSGKSIPRLWLTDYDRMPEDVDHEGAPFDLARKRATSFRRFGMCVAESTPGFEVDNPKWIARSPHEAPPTKGILALYNRGDRRRWQWQCPQCRGTFEPDFKHLVWPDTSDMMAAAEQAVLGCPYDGFPITADMRHEVQQAGRWIKDGQVWMPDGSIAGTASRSDIASFWLKGVAATFAPWPTLVMNYLKAEQEYELTGSEEALKTTVNVDQGHPYTPKAAMSERLPEELKARARDNGSTKDEPLVPDGVRILVATIDVQKNRFVVQVLGFGLDLDMHIVDRFEIRKSDRKDEDGERLWVKPDTHAEDWRLIVSQVIERTYALSDGSGRRMHIKATGCDSGGREGVTTNAYNFWRWLRDEHPAGHNRRFILLKGASNANAPRVQISYPDSDRKDRKAGARGEVPILLINPNTLKDQASLALDRSDPGGARLNFPDWLDDRFYTELTAENRTSKGWVKMSGRSNEAWDLFVYAIAVGLSRYVGIESIDWNDPPAWARPWDTNDLVFASGANQRFEIRPKVDYDLTKLAESLG